MLQINIQPYASDALEDAMRLAQTKALNSYSWSDMLSHLNYSWMNLYQRIISIDSGFYSRTVQLRERLTKLPPFMKNTILVYSAQRPLGFNREVFKASGMNDLQGTSTYHVSGFDLYCPSATYRNVWLEYVPIQPMLFFTHHNRDPKILEDNLPITPVRNGSYNLYNMTLYTGNVIVPIATAPTLNAVNRITLTHKNLLTPDTMDMTDTIFFKDPEWQLQYISCDFPYVFVTYKHSITQEYYSGFFKNIVDSTEFIEYNPFAFTGRNSNVEYVKTTWNDKTGMGVTIIDHNDADRYKELGWTPDTLLTYPAPEMYRYLVAMLADKLAALNESNVMGVTKELTEAKFAFEAFLAKDKSAWVRITNVNGPTIVDML